MIEVSLRRRGGGCHEALRGFGVDTFLKGEDFRPHLAYSMHREHFRNTLHMLAHILILHAYRSHSKQTLETNGTMTSVETLLRRRGGGSHESLHGFGVDPLFESEDFRVRTECEVVDGVDFVRNTVTCGRATISIRQ